MGEGLIAVIILNMFGIFIMSIWASKGAGPIRFRKRIAGSYAVTLLACYAAFIACGGIYSDVGGWAALAAVFLGFAGLFVPAIANRFLKVSAHDVS